MTFQTPLRWFTVLAATSVAGATLTAQSTGPDVEVMRHTIALAVSARLGDGVTVAVDLASVVPATWHGDVSTVAIDPAARLGAPLFVTFLAGPNASLRVSANVRVTADYLRASRTLLPGTLLAAEDLTLVHDLVPAVPLRHLPTAAEAIGARVTRRLAPGDLVQAAFIATPPVVTIGEPVTAIARFGDVEIAARLVAEDNGHIGDLIRIVNPDTKRTLRARIVRAGTVEVVDER